ncbi:hypothetical protein MPSEU_001010300 [Mayamaea pseudoterrestris]|nr:hypothetical protein MPSEU_001010300 [Mayamaea pseudoterrestris]
MAPPRSKRQRISEQPLKILGTSCTPSAAVIKVGQVCSDSGIAFEQQVIESYITLGNILSPLDADVFLAECFRKCAVHVPAMSNGKARFQLLLEQLFHLNPEMLLRETSSDNVFVWLKQSNGLIRSIEVSDPDAALALLKSGHSTYCRAPPSVEQHLVSSLLSQTGLGCGQYDPTGQSASCLGRGEVEVFISTAGHETNWHYDFQENFTLQLSGVKKWTLQKGAVKHPLRACTPHYASPESVEAQLKSAHLSNPDFVYGYPQEGVNAVGSVEEVTLRPGDVLYFPAGMWHKIDVIEPGVSINVSLMASSYASVTCQALQHVLLKDEHWRASVSHNSATNVVDQLQALLGKLPGVIEVLKRNYGAEAIIPPVMRAGRIIPLEGNDDDDDDDYDEEMDETDGERGSGRDDAPVELDSQFIEQFDMSETKLRDTLILMRLSINPLASMLRKDEITSFYQNINRSAITNDENTSFEDASNVTNAKAQCTYVLNVNYAGNDMHESSVRRCIRSNVQLLQQLYLLSKQRNSNDASLVNFDTKWLIDEEERATLGFLIHCGYLLWVPLDKDSQTHGALARTFFLKQSPTFATQWRGGSSSIANPSSTIIQAPQTADNSTLTSTAAINSTVLSLNASNTVSPFVPNIPDSLRGRQTLKKLRLGNVDIYLIGTAHVSNDSSAEVNSLLHAVRPHAIFVELCDARTALLETRQLDDESAAAANNKTLSFTQKLQATQQQQGGSRMQTLSTVLLTSVQEDYASTLGVELGGEFQCASRYWKSTLPQPFLLLGDRPLQLTLVRAWESLWWWPKVKVMAGLVWSSLFKPNKEEIRKWLASVMEDGSDVLTESFKDLQKHFPTLYTTIIDERDAWLAAKLTQTCRALYRRPTHEPFRLVAIVGAGHVPGICAKLTASSANQTVEQVLLDLCQTRKWAKDPVVQKEAIPMWVHDITQLQDVDA